nr:putative transmembrane protein [Raoultella sp. NCTC 9187]
MSVVFSTPSRASRLRQLWPLALFLALAAGAGVWLWQAWPEVMLQSAIWQRALNFELSGLLKAVAENPRAADFRCWRLALFTASCTPWGRGTARL